MAGVPAPKHECWQIEMSNSSGKFTDAFESAGIRDWPSDPPTAGQVLIETIESWHQRLAQKVDLPSSKFLLLTHDRTWRNFEIVCFDRNVLQRRDIHTEVEWVAEMHKKLTLAGYIELRGHRHRLWQFFPTSGGQLKMYPPFGWEEWRTGAFLLEEPEIQSLEDKARGCFPGSGRVVRA